jgi:hypothetical protein
MPAGRMTLKRDSILECEDKVVGGWEAAGSSRFANEMTHLDLRLGLDIRDLKKVMAWRFDGLLRFFQL